MLMLMFMFIFMINFMSMSMSKSLSRFMSHAHAQGHVFKFMAMDTRILTWTRQYRGFVFKCGRTGLSGIPVPELKKN